MLKNPSNLVKKRQNLKLTLMGQPRSLSLLGQSHIFGPQAKDKDIIYYFSKKSGLTSSVLGSCQNCIQNKEYAMTPQVTATSDFFQQA